ncbi:cyclophilin-like fold protein [Hymenobacter sp. HDW8]|uniref:cyclophilin-like fold protein n=1 Tax=Hymenobacter sp. HDW8 TaxID=2714932 RepID=UPI00140CD579|nr:cyclophilin-like fold protein [Hymenobacter sp. HDW8]QIL77181.1 hypothetical protein G7064_16005 [Hymenobacter sp. HDW8]
MKIAPLFFLLLLSLNLSACTGNQKEFVEPDTPTSGNMNLRITIGQRVFTATLDDNATVTAFTAKLPMTLTMVELNGNEKYVDLPDNLPTNASNPGTIQTGNLMLYGASTLVLFYKGFSTSYRYTRLGRIHDANGLAAALGAGNATVTYELAQ